MFFFENELYEGIKSKIEPRNKKLMLHITLTLTLTLR